MLNELALPNDGKNDEHLAGSSLRRYWGEYRPNSDPVSAP